MTTLDEIRQREARARAELRKAELERQLDQHEDAGTCAGSCNDLIPLADEEPTK